jgi:hypothetical protein
MATKQTLLQGLDVFASGAPGRDGAQKKALTALEKSSIAFDKAVDRVKSLAGTGSGKVPLLLPAAYLDRDRNNHLHDDRESRDELPLAGDN